MPLSRPFGLLCVIALFAYAPLVHAAPHPASAEECQRLTTQGIACIIGKTLYEPDNKYTGDEVAAATKFLLERNGTGTRGTECYTSQTDRITKLNPQFRVSLYKALSEIERLYGGKNIIQSGFRCDDINSQHNYGCAADIIWTTCQKNRMGFADSWRCSSDGYDKSTNSWNTPEQKWIDANGKNAPYNIHLRLRYAPEGHHVEPVNTQGCRTGGLVSASSSASPSASFANTIRQALGVPQQPTTQPQTVTPAQTSPQTTSLIDAFNLPTPILNATSSTDTSMGSTGPSIADKLAELAFGVKATTTTSSSTIPLIVDGRDVAQIKSTKTATPSTTPQTGGGAITQQTFATEDFSSTEINQSTYSGFSLILFNIQTALQKLLPLLTPFGLRSFDAESHEAEYYD